MGVVRFVRRFPLHEESGPEHEINADLLITPIVMPRDRAAVVSLAEEAREGTVSFSATGLLGELENRDGRKVTAWLAWQSATLGPRPVGVVLLAETRNGVSIPWLLVDPDVRRQGVARKLVATAVRHARLSGAAMIMADTLDSWPESTAFWPAVGFTRESSRAVEEPDSSDL